MRMSGNLDIKSVQLEALNVTFSVYLAPVQSASGLPPGTTRATLLPFKRIWSRCVTRMPSAVVSYASTFSSTMLT